MKTHLLDSSEPITEGRSQTAICGTEVKDAAFVLMWDADVMGLDLLHLVAASGMCRKCKKETVTQAIPLTGRYIYCITDGENAKQREREAAV